MVPKPIPAKALRHHWEIYLLVIPTAVLIALFSYYPAGSGVYHSFFRWDGADIAEWMGLRNFTDLFKTAEFWDSFKVAIVFGAWNVVKMIPSIAVAVCIHRVTNLRLQFLYRALFVIPMVIPGLVTVLIWRSFFFEATSGYLNRFLDVTGMMDALIWLDGHWLHWDLFKEGSRPAWLGDPRLILAACVLWGFPWVDSIAMLTHLAKLQGIPKEQYEAAEVEGISWWKQFTLIELPALAGSIYIVLVLVIINTLRDAGTILALAGVQGGPGGRATVPALFMFRKAFIEQDMGYACAIGLVLAVVVMSLQKAGTAAFQWKEIRPWERVATRSFGVGLGLVLLAAGRFPLLATCSLAVSLPWPALWRRLPRGPRDALTGAVRRALGRGRGAVGLRAGQLVKVGGRFVEPHRPPVPAWKERALEIGKHGFIWTVLAFAFLAFYLMAIVSLKTNQQFYEAPAVLSGPLHWENFATAWDMVAPTVANSLFITISSTAVTLVLALLASYFFARVRVPGSTFLWNAILVLMTLPTVATLIPLFRLLRDLQLLNTLSALVLVSVAGGEVFAIFWLRNFIAGIPQEMFDAAEVDGATHVEQIRLIVVPQTGAILGTVGVMHFVAQWNEFLLPLIVMRDHSRLPVTVELLRMSGEYVKYWGPLMAGYTLASVPIVILFLFTMRFYTRGLTEGMH